MLSLVIVTKTHPRMNSRLLENNEKKSMLTFVVVLRSQKLILA